MQAVLIPRSDLAQGKLRKELDFPGIYFLFGEGEVEAKPIVYIGQTENARKRFDSHNNSKSRIDPTASTPESIGNRRKSMLEAGVIEEINGVYVFQQNYLFPSPSNAAATVLGASANE